jgi:pimeloyl-ACP methyl ester carboxylesterase
MANPSIILVHGAWADGSSWAKVIPLLVGRGLKAVAVQLPLTSLADDVATVQRAVELEDGPVVLAGHSYGGAVITEAGNDPKVKALAYIAAFSPDAGESAASLGGTVDPAPLGTEIRPDAHGFLRLTEAGVRASFAQDLDRDEQAVVFAVQGPTAGASLGGTISHPAWRTRPAWSLIAGQDGAIQPALERRMAERMNATTREIDSSHLPMLSHPEVVADIIAQAAA